MNSYIEISKQNLLHNFQLFRSLLPKESQVAAVIKANAYGHGLPEVAQILANHTDFFQVDDVAELRTLRRISSKPTLVLGFVDSSELEEAIQLDGTLAIYDAAQLPDLDRIGHQLGKIPQVHLTIDAFLGRDGILLENLDHFLTEFGQYQVNLAGIYAHFSNLEDTEDRSHARRQADTYHQALQILKVHGYKNVQTHMSATAAILIYDQSPTAHDQRSTVHDLVRLGIGLYGLWPSELIRKKFETPDFQLKPVLRWVSQVAQLKNLPPNFPIGYGLTFITTKPTKVALIPQGYSDGYDRKLSNRGEVLINGTRCRVLGRVAMNMFVVDVTHLPNVQIEEEVVLLGNQGREEVAAEELAEKADTINYEIAARLNPLLPRVIV